ncbi:MAG: MBL fold metallo-hydrolase [Acidobacteriota bacterium]|nr:MBL fold metallo-hydrolase [Acidobacteriota bacterium]
MPRLRSRPHRMAKLNQLLKVVRESHAQPLTGEHRLPEIVPPGELGVTFIGHSSFLLQIGGLNLLVDPVFATRLVILRRQRRAGIHTRDLPPIDLVLVTHAHMDHMNLPTLRRIVRNCRLLARRAPAIVVPHGCEDLVSALGFSNVITMQWWEQRVILGLTVTMTPSKHWGARMFSDTHRGFGGYNLASGRHSIYHSGDTAYFPGFREIGQRLHPEVALLPIGAYYPDTYRGVHTSPEEALHGFLDLGSSLMIPMHFGTFPLGREPMEEPPVRLLAEARRLGVEGRVRILDEGETLRLPNLAA